MFNFKGVALFVCAILGLSAAAFVDTLSKCSIKDGECLTAQLTYLIKILHKTGVPELGISPLEPLEFKNITVSVFDVYDLVIPEGEITGIKNCVVNTYNVDIEKGHSDMILTCNSYVSSVKYDLNASNPLLKPLFGGKSIRGKGNAKAEIEKLEMNYDFYFDLVKNKDGDIFFDWIPSRMRYVYRILGKVKFDAEDIFFDAKDARQEVLSHLTENSDFVMSTIGRPFINKAMELLYLYFGKFFRAVPTKYYIIEDLSQYVKK